MKILRRPKKQTPWWVGKYVECDNCTAVFQLEEKDRVKEIPVTTPHDEGYDSGLVQLRCPGCKKKIRVPIDLLSNAPPEDISGFTT